MVFHLTISTHAPAGGATSTQMKIYRKLLNFYSRPCGRGDDGKKELKCSLELFLLTPLREGRRYWMMELMIAIYFYSRPCGRGDEVGRRGNTVCLNISTHAPAGGATQFHAKQPQLADYFYSRPCGRGDDEINVGQRYGSQFLLTPLREGRPGVALSANALREVFLLTPLREGRLFASTGAAASESFLLTPLREGRQPPLRFCSGRRTISTHAPAGGATRSIS